ncbi:glycosyltransferase family 2 protein [Lachnospiraceae bacterium 29-84]
MMRQSEVDIICLCYNGSRFLNQFINCIVSQTYDNIVLIMVNDGSTDNSLEIIEAARKRVEDRGYKYIVQTQKNGGPSSAYNLGMKSVAGDYVMQIDVDDTIKPETIEKMAKYLDSNSECSIIRTNGVYHYLDQPYNDELLTKTEWDLEEQMSQDICEKIILGKVYLLCCSFMFRRVDFEKIYPTRTIAPWRNGQNYQVLLPLAYRYKAAFINENLFSYTIRNDSLEHTPITFQQEIKRTEESAYVIYDSLIKAGATKEYAEKWSSYREHKRKLYFAYQQRNKKQAKESYNVLKKFKLNNKVDYLDYVCTVSVIMRCFRKLLGMLYRKYRED